MRWRVAVVLGAVALGVGYAAGHQPPPRETEPSAALRAYQSARVDAMAACAKHGYATAWGDVVPDSRIANECLSIVAQPCSPVGVMVVPDVDEEPPTGPRI
jgi:hypothetical protein